MTTNDKLSHGFVLGERIVEPRLGVVITDDEVRHLAPKAMSLLLLLAERQGELVSRQEIAERLWNGSGVTHETLTRHVSEVRRCLDDDSRHPRFVETVPRQGYRLISTVVPEDDYGDEAASSKLNGNGSSRAANDPDSLGGFVRELRQRKVVRAALLYCLVVWLSLQVGEIIFPALGVPEWTLTFLVLLGVLGFPITLVLAWAFDLTPGGLLLDVSVRDPASPTGRFRRLHLLVIVTLLIVILVLAGQLIVQARAADVAAPAIAQTCTQPAMLSRTDREFR